MVTLAQKYIVKNKFKEYLPEETDFEIVDEVLPEVEEKQFLINTEYISVDPYMRSFAIRKRVPYAQFGFQVGQIVASKNENYPINSYVVTHAGWSTHVLSDERPDSTFGIVPYEPPIGKLRKSLALGALGMPGMAAYLGLLDICRPRPGDILCVTSAAGAVGSIVGQIAKLKDCIVIGIAGSDDKTKFLIDELGFNYAFNYKTERDNIKDRLKKIAPRGINCFFDNVGGDLGSTILESMADGGRVANCGSISTYGQYPQVKKKPKHASITMEEFSFAQWEWEKQLHALNQLKTLIENGHIKAKETITEGFENLPQAFIGMLKGDGIGKCVVKVI